MIKNITRDVVEHVTSPLKGKWTWSRLRRAYVLFQMRQNQGASYTGEIDAMFTKAMIAVPFMHTLNQLFNINIPMIPCIIIFITTFFTFTYMLGYIDQKYLKIWQEGNEISTREVNPYYEKLEKDLEEVKVMLKSLKEKKKEKKKT